MRFLILAFALCLQPAMATRSQPTAPEAGCTRGPENGTLIAIGGGSLPDEILQLFIERAGGVDAPIVYVPTAMPGKLGQAAGERSFVVRRLRQLGCTDVTVLHTRDPERANAEEFFEPLTNAGGVWFSGGRQWRFADSYLDTRTERAFHDVLARGGVIAGSSAGATIQASYLVRGAPEGNQIMMAKGHERGFGFLRCAAIDQHVIARGRLDDMVPVIERHPELLGIGIDEGTAIVVTADRLEVIGRSRVAIYDHERFGGEGEAYFFLKAGEALDLATRRKAPARENDG